MKICSKKFSNRAGFTMVEVIVAVAIIAVLISLIIPALNMVQRSADMARQRAQFHSIEIALEAFRADFGDYPESDDSGLMIIAYPGAMKLAEAVIGLDGFGFHPDSIFQSYGRDENGESLYLNSVPPAPDPDISLRARRGPYLELETANAVKLRDLYRQYGINGLQLGSVRDRFVLCDMFRLVKNNATGKRTGMPILYYRASTSNFEHYPDPGPPPAFDNCIYDYRDNDRIVLLEDLWEGTVLNPMRSNNDVRDGPQIFYDNTLNPNFPPSEPDPPDPGIPGRPYRAESFILLSAGPDGQYGTPDDVFNFNKAE